MKPPMNALHTAAYNADLEAVQALLSQGEPVDQRDEKGFTPLLWSCLRGAVGRQAPVADALLAAGADPDATTSSGDSNCLILAAQAGVLELIDVLFAWNAKVNADAEGVTPLMVAARAGDAEVVSRLLRAGADPTIICGSFDAEAYARHGGHSDLADVLAALGAGG